MYDCGIGRYFRIFVYLCVLDNNKVEIVFGLFVDVVGEYGLLLCVRLDKGGENVDILW